MNTMLLAAMAIAATAAVPQDQGAKPVSGPAAQAPAVAPQLPIAKTGDATTKPAPAPATALAELGAGNPPAATQAETWGGLDDVTRYLMIMGSADGFSAAGDAAPCFPGENNSTLDAALRKGGFSAKDPDALPEALAKLTAPREKCTGLAKRGYTDQLLKKMPDQHLATYLTGLVRAYSRYKPCPAEAQGYAAAMVTTAIFSSADDAQPIAVIQPAMLEGCKGLPGK